MILDATAGNRTMWRTKQAEQIIYIDCERKLTVKPTIFCNNTQTPFKNGIFDTIFFDPPHSYGEGHPYYKYPDVESFSAKWKGYGKIPRYYGWDKLRSRAALATYLYRAQQEFQRILKDNGLLWLKWSEIELTRSQIAPIFNDWNELLRIHVNPEVHPAGKINTYWVCLCKKKEKITQSHLG